MPLAIPVPLLTALQNNKCILFAGAGLSIAAGYPSWRELVMALVDEARTMPQARNRGIDQLIAEGDLLTLAEFARTTMGASYFPEALRNRLTPHVAPTPAHHIIAQTNYRGIITTNYDRLLETAVTLARGEVPFVFTQNNIDQLATALYNPEFFIFKLHGDISVPATVVLTSRDYDRMILSSPYVRTFLQAVFLNYTLLFVGYSLRDPDFQLLLRELTLIYQGYTARHFALIPDPAEFTLDDLLGRMNIQVIPYAPGTDHAAVAEFLSGIQTIIPYVARTARVTGT